MRFGRKKEKFTPKPGASVYAIVKSASELALEDQKAYNQNLAVKKTMETLTRTQLYSFLILAYCEECDYSEYMIRFFWDKAYFTMDFILHKFHYDRHPHKVQIAFMKVPDSSPFLDIPICSSCGREHTYKTGQGKTTPCDAFKSKPVDKTFKWFNTVLERIGYEDKEKPPALTGNEVLALGDKFHD